MAVSSSDNATAAGCPMQMNSVSMSECGADQGFGECDGASGRCVCTMGWTGADCSEPTCCPVWVFIISAVVVGMLMAAVPLCYYYQKRQKGKPKEDLVAKRQKEIAQRRKDRLQQESRKVAPSAPEAAEVTTEPVYPLKSNVAGAWTAPTSPSVEESSPKMTSAERLRRSLDSSVPEPQRAPPAPRPRPVERSRTAASASSSTSRTSSSSPKQPQRSRPTQRQRQQATAPPSAAASGTSAAAGSGASEAADSTLPERALAVQRRMREMMDEPLDVRKQTFRELVLEYHPDKNANPDAKEVFQVVNEAKGWFLQSA